MASATTPEGRYLLRAMARARKAGIAQIVRIAVADGALAVAAIGTVAVATAAVTLRGDQARLVAAAAAVAAILLAIGIHVRAKRRRYGRAGDAKGLVRTAATMAYGAGTAARSQPLPLAEREALLVAVELATDPAQSDAPLARAHLRRWTGRLRRLGLDLASLLPRMDPLPRLRVLGLLVAAWAVASTMPRLRRAALWTIHGVDARPPPSVSALLRDLSITVVYPPHTRRPERTLHNVTGSFRVPAGTEVRWRFRTEVPAATGTLIFTPKLPEAGEVTAVPLSRAGDAFFEVAMVVKAAGSVEVDLTAEDGRPMGRSSPIRVVLEPDRPPVVEFAAPPEDVPTESDARIPLAFRATDDFGIAEATLVIERPDGTQTRLPIPLSGLPARKVRATYRWDLAALPVDERTDVSYFIEVRDNDPGLGPKPLADPPGKVGRTRRRRLVVEDEEARHASNLATLSEVRDGAVDVLAARLELRADAGRLAAPALVGRARALHAKEFDLLRRLADLADRLAMDTVVRKRRAEMVAAIHRRWVERHRAAERILAAVPAEGESPPESLQAAARGLAAHNRRAVPPIEDDVIRLDDLLDTEVVQRVERLLARLRVTQRKIVDLLEQLAAGDETVRPMLESLMQRRREELRLLAEARALLGRETPDEYLNEDAWKVLRKLEDERLASTPQNELERARRELEELRAMHESLQQQVADGSAGASTLSPEERARMALLRELSRIEDVLRTKRAETRNVQMSYRSSAEIPTLSDEDRRAIRGAVERAGTALEEVDDTDLGRDGRNALFDAQDALDRLARIAGDEAADAARAYDAARAAQGALDRARRAAEKGTPTARKLAGARKVVAGLARRLAGRMPPPRQVLGEQQRRRMEGVADELRATAERVERLLRSADADPLPESGRQALRDAATTLRAAAPPAVDLDFDRALEHQRQSGEHVRRAIDSLRRRSPPPPTGGAGDASMEAEQDRSLRDLVMDALRKTGGTELDPTIERYYEELLR